MFINFHFLSVFKNMCMCKLLEHIYLLTSMISLALLMEDLISLEFCKSSFYPSPSF